MYNSSATIATVARPHHRELIDLIDHEAASVSSFIRYGARDAAAHDRHRITRPTL